MIKALIDLYRSRHTQPYTPRHRAEANHTGFWLDEFGEIRSVHS